MSDGADVAGEIEELLAFLPLFDIPGRSFVDKWVTPGGSGDMDSMPYPVYPEDVERFFRLVEDGFWTDTSYDPETTGGMIRDPAVIAAADVNGIRSMLTFCVRGERFCEGHWAQMLESGIVVDILKRLGEIREASSNQGERGQ